MSGTGSILKTIFIFEGDFVCDFVFYKGVLGERVFYFLYTLGKLAKRGGGWLPSGAIEGCYPPGMLELSEILILVKNPSPKRK